MMDLYSIECELKKNQNPKRFDHSVGVRYTSICLAMRYGEDINKASYSGLLHDCAKYMPGEKLLSECRANGLPVSKVEEKNPFLLHAKLGAFYAENIYGVNDEDILNAIRWHTTSRPGMSLLEKIVFTADYIEPMRYKAPNLDKIRQMAFTELDQAVVLILKQTLDYLYKKGGDIDPMTEDSYKYYSKN